MSGGIVIDDAVGLLRIQAIVDPDGMTIVVSPEAENVLVGSRVTHEIETALRDAFSRMPRIVPLDARPALDSFAAILRAPDASRGSFDYVSGPSYLVPAELAFDIDACLASANARLATDLAMLADANPGNWHPIEWRELLAGQLGPVAIATVGDRVASICHTPRVLTPEAAEPGVWTHPDFRGKRLACATTAAWATLVRAPERHVFYSTHRDNTASQRVAARLRLPLLGWLHRLALPSPDELHPLCSVRS